MGNYLEAIFHTGFYYTLIGVFQVLAALLLLIPRTAVLGAVVYFPIILNICLLSISVRFEGSLVSSPLMVLANLYLLCWYYQHWKYLLPFNHNPEQATLPTYKNLNRKCPTFFFLGTMTTVVAVGLGLSFGFEMMPRNTRKECKTQCEDSANPAACITFCDCIHTQGQPLGKCLETYNQAPRN
ncbi:DoxX family protein [Rufibacter sp. LB8]|nr:DoxX family protein [Rufibacter sp. LB8]